jgi:hypothetical protein
MQSWCCFDWHGLCTLWLILAAASALELHCLTTGILMLPLQNLNFGQAPCDKAGNATLDPTRTLTLHPKGNGTNPCGYPFGISFR